MAFVGLAGETRMLFPSGRAGEALSALESPVLMLAEGAEGTRRRCSISPHFGELVLTNFRRNVAGSLMEVVLQRTETCLVHTEQPGARGKNLALSFCRKSEMAGD